VPPSLPGLHRAQKIQKRAARVGFDWTDPGPVLDKVEEEFAEFRQAVEHGENDHAAGELGDIIFSLVNVARHYGIDAEASLRYTIDKFARRFRHVEARCTEQGIVMKETPLELLDTFWEEGKRTDAPPTPDTPPPGDE